eukprot:2342877-Lingulodinium_polyedra.AAC.1
MHVAIANGLAQFEVHAFLQTAKAVGITVAMLESFLQTQWQWPGDKNAKGKTYTKPSALRGQGPAT